MALMLTACSPPAQAPRAPSARARRPPRRVVCGKGNGKKATGAPIKLGGTMTLIPGVDFTTIGKIAEAYFKCVNDNGGINGRPIQYTILTEQLDPAQQLSLAKKFVGDGVVGIVGNTSLTECGNTNKYYRSKGYYIIGAGVPGECFSSSNFAAVNMGPRYSNIGAAQALLKRGAKSLVVSSPAAVAEYSNGGPALVAKAAGIPFKGFAENLPLTDTDSIVQKLVQAAGPGGGVVLNYTPESATPLLKSAAKLGLIDKVIWGSSTPAANELVAGENPAFDGKIFVNSEFGLLTNKGADMTLYRQITAKYAPSIPIQSFGQMGFLVGRFVTKALLTVEGPRDEEVVQQRCPRSQEREVGHPLQAVVLRQRAAVPHPEQHGHHGYLRQRQAQAGRRLLPDPGGRSAAEADPRLGEEVQAEHREVARSARSRCRGRLLLERSRPRRYSAALVTSTFPEIRAIGADRTQRDIGAECIASSASRSSASTGSSSSRTSCSASPSAGCTRCRA